jgi:hypothetical protein
VVVLDPSEHPCFTRLIALPLLFPLQQYAIHPNYATSINALLPEKKKADMSAVQEKAKTAHLVHKDPNFQPADKGKSFMGMPF